MALFSINASAQDSIAIYTNWHNISYNEPDTVIHDATIAMQSPTSIKIKPISGKNKTLKKLLKDQALAVSINDSVWYVNTNYLRKHYDGEYIDYLDEYTPLYFNEKIAYTQYSDESDMDFLSNLSDLIKLDMGTAQLLQIASSYGYNFQNAYVFIINPRRLTVEALTADKMSQILRPYLDIRRRYEAMYYFEEPIVINEFFLEYTNRILEDDSVPPLVD